MNHSDALSIYLLSAQLLKSTNRLSQHNSTLACFASSINLQTNSVLKD